MKDAFGYSGTLLFRKLGIKAGHRVLTLWAPAHFARLLGELPEGVRVVAKAKPRPAAGARVRRDDVVVVFVTSDEGLARRLPYAQRFLAWDGGLWVAWPKAGSALDSGVREDHVRRRALEAGLVDNKVCAIDGDWSGLRLVYRKKDRPPFLADR